MFGVKTNRSDPSNIWNGSKTDENAWNQNRIENATWTHYPSKTGWKPWNKTETHGTSITAVNLDKRFLQNTSQDSTCCKCSNCTKLESWVDCSIQSKDTTHRNRKTVQNSASGLFWVSTECKQSLNRVKSFDSVGPLLWPFQATMENDISTWNVFAIFGHGNANSWNMCTIHAQVLPEITIFLWTPCATSKHEPSSRLKVYSLSVYL